MKNIELSSINSVKYFLYNIKSTNENAYGPRLVDSQPRHNRLHLREAHRLKIGRIYNLRMTGNDILNQITGKFLGMDEEGELGFEFQDSFVKTFHRCELGLLPYPEEENGRWDNWQWVEALNIWQALF